jgi:hypothetical protein
MTHGRQRLAIDEEVDVRRSVYSIGTAEWVKVKGIEWQLPGSSNSR